ncbi:hypothetical protein GPK66_07580 [Eubacterium ramulus]|nr:hypothetical protein [Eubacterium ramulus]
MISQNYVLLYHICRCTGYKKIMDAVEVAAKIKWEGKGIPKKENFLLAVLTNTINTIHKWSGCKT